jgi:hypothetical protein
MNKEIMREAGFNKEVERAELGLCPFCGMPVKIEDFRDEISRREYKISNLCQICQDDFFGK